jgi:small subunit ribosomal protein S17
MPREVGRPARTVIGRVVSDKVDKTRTVLIERHVQHALYKKYIRRSTRIHVHDERNESHDGDVVAIRQSRPHSKTKAWLIESIIEKGRP